MEVFFKFLRLPNRPNLRRKARLQRVVFEVVDRKTYTAAAKKALTDKKELIQALRDR